MNLRPFTALPTREQVFAQSLRYHGYRLHSERNNLKPRPGYIIPSSMREDASGVDFWIKPPRHTRVYPVQVTQRGTGILKKLQPNVSEQRLADAERVSNTRLRSKRKSCKKSRVLFVLVRDHLGTKTSRSLAWGDVKALRYALARCAVS